MANEYDTLPEKIAFPINKFCYEDTKQGCEFNCAVTKGAVLSQQFPKDINGAHITFAAQGLSVPYKGKRYIYQTRPVIYRMAMLHDEDNTLKAEFEFTGELLKVVPMKKATRARKDRINILRKGKSTKTYDRFASVRRALLNV